MGLTICGITRPSGVLLWVVPGILVWEVPGFCGGLLSELGFNGVDRCSYKEFLDY